MNTSILVPLSLPNCCYLTRSYPNHHFGSGKPSLTFEGSDGCPDGEGPLFGVAIVSDVGILVEQICRLVFGEIVSEDEVEAGEEVDEEERGGEEEGERQVEFGDRLSERRQVGKPVRQEEQSEVRNGDQSEGEQHDRNRHCGDEHTCVEAKKGRRGGLRFRLKLQGVIQKSVVKTRPPRRAGYLHCASNIPRMIAIFW